MNGADSHGSSGACRNCSSALTGKYCATCGQPDMSPNPKLSDFTDDFVGEFLHWDGKFPATMRALLSKPGFLTTEFLAGRRRSWLSPFRLYLSISIVYFLAGPLIERVTGFSAKTLARIEVTGDSATREDMRILSDSAAFVNAPEIRENAVVSLIGAGKAWTLVQNQTMLKDIMAATMPKVMFALMPFFALLTWATWKSGGLNFPAHLVFAFHLHAALFAAMLVVRVIEPTGSIGLIVLAQLGLLAYSTWYIVRGCRVALGGTTGQVVARSSIVGLAYLPVALALILGATILAINAL